MRCVCLVIGTRTHRFDKQFALYCCVNRYCPRVIAGFSGVQPVLVPFATMVDAFS